MRDIDQILKVKKEIKFLEDELKDSSSQLGGVFYDLGLSLKDNTIEAEIDKYEKSIPLLKEKMDSLKNYNMSITEAQEEIVKTDQKIKEIEGNLGSILEKVGVELYCFIGEKELKYKDINTVYHEIKSGELKSETLENTLYSYENSMAKSNLLSVFSKPFKIRTIKKDIKVNNKESLKKFRKLGRLYTQIPSLIEEESNESILDVLEEYKNIDKSLKSQIENKKSFEKKILENEKKIQDDSNGVKLKTLYNQLEQEIVDNQNIISNLLNDLGTEVAKLDVSEFSDEKLISKWNAYKEKESSIVVKEKELLYLEKNLEYKKLVKEISEKEERIAIEDNHIAKRIKDLDSHKEEVKKQKLESDEMRAWLEANIVT